MARATVIEDERMQSRTGGPRVAPVWYSKGRVRSARQPVRISFSRSGGGWTWWSVVLDGVLDGRTARGAGVVLEGQSTVCKTTGKILILALETGLGWLAIRAGW